MLNVAWLLLVGVLAFLGLHDGVPPWSGSAFLLGLLALLLELMAIALPEVGYFSGSPALLAAMGMRGQGPAHAWLVLFVAVALRTLVRDVSLWWRGLRDVFALGVMLTLLQPLEKVMGVIAVLPAGMVYLAIWRTLQDPRSRQADNLVKWVWQHQVATLFLAPVIAVLAKSDPLYVLWTVPLLGGLHRAVHTETLRIKIEQVRELEEREQRSRQALREVSNTLQATRETLHLKGLTQNVLVELSHQLVQSTDVESTVQIALNYLRTKVPCDSAGVVLVEEGHPILKASFPSGLVVLSLFLEKAWRENRALDATAVPREHLPVPQHPYALVLPLSGEGVLYVGRASHGAYNDSEAVMLGAVAGQVTLGLQAARRFEEQQRTLASLFQGAKTAAVGQLAAGLAHELNTPLAAIALQMDMARQKPDDPKKVLSKLDAAQRSLEQAQRILKRLLFYSREGASTQQTLDLNQVVQDTLDFLGSTMFEQGVALERNLQPLAPITGNANELHQALVNILTNARQAVLEPGAAEKLIVVSTAMVGGRRHILVQDGGPGIPVEIADRIFEPFFTTRPVGHGVGLGLSVAQKIVQSHGGSLRARNRTDGPGAEFLMEL